jgi:hypothetical protein
MAKNDLSLKCRCPICGAAPQEVCELNTGAPRFESHIERGNLAKNYIPRPIFMKPLVLKQFPKQ